LVKRVSRRALNRFEAMAATAQTIPALFASVHAIVTA
jgi:hypothetical protein